MISYPTNFPLPTTSLDGETESPVIRTSLQTGLVEQEGRFATAKRTTRTTWRLSEAELLVFENWFANDLAGGVLVFGMTLPKDGALATVPVRFVGGSYDVTHDGAFWFSVSATIEQLLVESAPSNRTPAVPVWKRLEIDPMTSQVMTLSHRNARLVTNPADGDTTTLRILPPTSKAAWIYFGIKQDGDGEVLITSEDVDPLPPEDTVYFPGTLPNVNSAFSMNSVRQASRLEMESGHSRQWARFDTANKTHKVQWEFDLEELHTFQDFYFTTLRSGGKTFFLKLPVDGQFEEVPVRFVGGSYNESYAGVSRFVVNAQVERITEQTETPETERPYPVFYSPTVNVTANRRIYSTDAFKMFVVNPAEGQTINLHIRALTIEFGVLIKGLGNVLITRTPFLVDLGSVGSDSSGQTILPPSFTLTNTINNIGSVPGDSSGQTVQPTVFNLVSVAEDIGAIPPDYSGQTIQPTSLTLLAVLEDIGAVPADSTGQTIKPTAFTLDTP
jgi:hypothetical protein